MDTRGVRSTYVLKYEALQIKIKTCKEEERTQIANEILVMSSYGAWELKDCAIIIHGLLSWLDKTEGYEELKGYLTSKDNLEYYLCENFPDYVKLLNDDTEQYLAYVREKMTKN